MRLRVAAVVVALSLLASAADVDRCVIVAGQGCGNFKIGKSRRSDVYRNEADESRLAKDGVDLQFNRKGFLDTIVISNPAFKTDLGVAVGDEEKTVKRAYGAPKKVGRFRLEKGEGEPIGFVGDRTLVYSGIWFTISNDKVWAILVLAK